MELKVEARSTPEEQRCSFCHDDLLATDERIDCPHCAVGFHTECFQDELGGHCVTIGCETYKPTAKGRMSLLRRRLRVRRRRRLLDGSMAESSAERTGHMASMVLAGVLVFLLGLGLHPGHLLYLIPALLLCVHKEAGAGRRSE